ncbi:MAG: polyhydroxybutyrate depolymerase [Neomegalonema sp.]|nr:polyhydroxybutyrate depolymerase [Neomegalonema sp.]
MIRVSARKLSAAMGAVLLLCAASASACGVRSDCLIDVRGQGERTYRIYLPPTEKRRLGPDGKIGAIVFAHGYRGAARGVMRNAGLLRMADRLGVAFIALNADGHDDWILPGAPFSTDYAGRREIEYTRAVVADAVRRFGLQRRRMMASGFSAGGMLMWNLICEASDLFPAFAPHSGVFWNPLPRRCKGRTANVIHFHGTLDPIVPMEGRAIARTSQGDVRAAIALYVAHGDFGAPRSARWGGDLTCERRSNGDGKLLELCTYRGRHDFRLRYLERAWRRFAARGIL